jgi:hypothetical protein
MISTTLRHDLHHATERQAVGPTGSFASRAATAQIGQTGRASSTDPSEPGTAIPNSASLRRPAIEIRDGLHVGAWAQVTRAAETPCMLSTVSTSRSMSLSAGQPRNVGSRMTSMTPSIGDCRSSWTNPSSPMVTPPSSGSGTDETARRKSSGRSCPPTARDRRGESVTAITQPPKPFRETRSVRVRR